MFCLHICLSAPYASSASGGQERTSDSLELESRPVVSCNVGAGIELGSLDRAASACKYIYPAPVLMFLEYRRKEVPGIHR